MWAPDLSRYSGPAYKRIAAAIAGAMQSKELNAGMRLPTHRALADALGVTVGTVTRGYAEAERQNLVEARVGSGTYIKQHSPAATSFTIADETAITDQTIDFSYSIPLALNQEEDLQQELEDIGRTPGLLHRLLQYQPEYGMAHHRAAGRRWLEMTGFDDVDEGRILISNGGQHGFFTILLSLCQRGDTVLCDGLTYPGFIAAARTLGLRVVGLTMDAEGSTPDDLELACQRYRPRAMYVMPRLNNPTCRQMSAARIEAIAAICRRYSVHVIEDDVQGCLTDIDQPTFTNAAPDITLLVSSCSKALAGGLRVGFIYPTAATFELVANGLRAGCWMTAPLTGEVAARWILEDRATRIMEAQRTELLARHGLVREALQGFRFETVTGGFNVWLHLPQHWRAVAFVEQAAQRDVLVKPAEVFAAGQYPAPQAVRLCIGGDISRVQLVEGLARLKSILEMEKSPVQHLSV